MKHETAAAIRKSADEIQNQCGIISDCLKDDDRLDVEDLYIFYRALSKLENQLGVIRINVSNLIR